MRNELLFAGSSVILIHRMKREVLPLGLLMGLFLAATGSANEAGDDTGGGDERVTTDPEPSWLELHKQDLGIRFAGLLGYGTNGRPNLYRTGFGGRVGYIPSIPIQPYIGFVFVYHRGTTESSDGYRTQWRNHFFGFELGKELGMGPIFVTPYGSIGWATALGETCVVGGGCEIVSSDVSKNTLYYGPGISVALPVGILSLGVDARLNIVSNGLTTGDAVQGASGFAAYGMVGLRL